MATSILVLIQILSIHLNYETGAMISTLVVMMLILTSSLPNHAIGQCFHRLANIYVIVIALYVATVIIDVDVDDRAMFLAIIEVVLKTATICCAVVFIFVLAYFFTLLMRCHLTRLITM